MPETPPRVVHEISISSSRIDIAGHEAVVTFTYTLEDVWSLVKFRLGPGGLLSPEAYREQAPLLEDYVSRHFVIDGDGELGQSRLMETVFPGAQPIPASSLRTPLGMVLRYAFSHPVTRLKIHCTLFQDVAGEARHLCEVTDGRSMVFDWNRQDHTFPAVASFWTTLSRKCLADGRILGARWPLGILLLLLLLLVAPRLRRLKGAKGGPGRRVAFPPKNAVAGGPGAEGAVPRVGPSPGAIS